MRYEAPETAESAAALLAATADARILAGGTDLLVQMRSDIVDPALIVDIKRITETRRIIEECYEQALVTLRGSRDRLDRLAHTLLDHETLEEEEAYAAVGISPGIAPAAIARGEAPGTTPAPGTPPSAARVGPDHITPSASR